MPYYRESIILYETSSPRKKTSAGYLLIEKTDKIIFSVGLSYFPDKTEQYKIYIAENDGSLFEYTLSGRKNATGECVVLANPKYKNKPDFSDGFAVSVKQNDFIYSGKKNSNYIAEKNLERILSTSEKNINTQTQKESATICSAPSGQTQYDDEAIADSNYFLYNKSAKTDIKGDIYGKQSTAQFDENAKRESEDVQNGIQETASFDTGYNDENNNAFEKEEGGGNFFEEHRIKIEELFDNFEEYDELKQVLNESKFVKIDYSKDKEYIVGIIYEKNRAKYIAYGVPSRIDTPPEFRKKSHFVPKSVFDDVNGFYMLFQDAVSGEIVY